MRWFLVLSLTALVGCGGRVSSPVPQERSFDGQLSCVHLSGEYNNNLKRVQELTEEIDDSNTNNVGLLLTGALFMDLSDTERKEIEAAIVRNDRLIQIGVDKGCDEMIAHQKEATADENINDVEEGAGESSATKF